MKPSQIKKVLDATRKANKLGKKFVPLFSGDPGIGKSEIIQAWAREQKSADGSPYGFIDLRPAYVEAPDFVGLVSIEKGRTNYNLPEFWPTEGEGIILLEEVNRANPSVMNALMQLLTDFKVMNYKVPKGWIIASVINPESADCDVNSMDSAFKNRFTIFEVNYDKGEFVEFIEQQQWHTTLISWIKEYFVYYKVNELPNVDSVYISPRSLSKLNTIEIVEADPEVRNEVIASVLGKHYGPSYVDFCNNSRPLLAQDFIINKEVALKRLEDLCNNAENFRGDVINTMIDSVTEAVLKKELDLLIVLDISERLPADLIGNMLLTVLEKIENSDDCDIDLDSFMENNASRVDALVEKRKVLKSKGNK